MASGQPFVDRDRAREAMRATVLGRTTVISDTGRSTGSDDAQPGVAGHRVSTADAEALHTTTIGWPDQATAEASLAALGLIP